jgi:hypothetical protein
MSLRVPFLALLLAASPALAADPPIPVEVPPTDPKAAKVVLVAGSNYFKPGEHDYVAGCRVLADLLRQTDRVAPVFALDWPKKPETFAGARAVVFVLDGGDKHPFLTGDRLAEVRKLAEAGTGLVFLHQMIDVPKDHGDRVRDLAGAAWEKGHSQRAHWVATFDKFPDHPVFRGVKPFTTDDGWLYKLRFVDGQKGVTPLLKTVNPKTPIRGEPGAEAVVAWAYERTGGGRSFTFTGTHLHASFKEEGYRRFLTNGVLWAAGVEVPTDGAPVKLDAADLPKYLTAPAMKQ